MESSGGVMQTGGTTMRESHKLRDAAFRPTVQNMRQRNVAAGRWGIRIDLGVMS
jgi:hypothetical protein